MSKLAQVFKLIITRKFPVYDGGHKFEIKRTKNGRSSFRK